MLNALSKTIRFDNASKGFDPTEGGVNRYLLLAISEICEAQNDLRDGHDFTEVWYEGERKKPCGFTIELADAAIRILDIGSKFSIDFEEEPQFDHNYGETLDDWLLGIAQDIAMCHSYEPTSVDFHINLRSAFYAIKELCEANEIKLFEIIDAKLAYNRTRPPKHGRQF